MTFHIVTLFPESFGSYIESSIVGRAIREKKIKFKFYNPRDFTARSRAKSRDEWSYKRTDNKPYGGGPGMVMEALPVIKATEKALRQAQGKSKKVIIFSPNGKQFTNGLARTFARKIEHLFLICGRYEGIDARVKKILRAEEISVGPFVLTGGELPAMIVLDAVSRQIEGVLGKIESLEEDRVASSEVYTRPEILKYKNKNYKVPKILLSGNHAEIEKWRAGRQTKH